MADNETMATEARPPAIQDGPLQQIGEAVHVIPDHRINLVPNVGIVVGGRSTLVVDCGMGPANGRRVLERARELSDQELLLTITHFHPEHGFGAQAFVPGATIVYNQAQLEELVEKGAQFVEMFTGFGPEVAEQLVGVELVMPHVTYGGEAADIDIGGRRVELRYHGPAHTRGDQIVWLPDERILFAGDLVENRFFPILPDADTQGSLWIALLERLEALGPAVVVPGHGEVGDSGLIVEVREYLKDVRSRVRELAGEGLALDAIKATLAPELITRYSTWENPVWVDFAIENFHGELDG